MGCVCVSTHQECVLAGQSRQYCEVTCVLQLGLIFCVGSVNQAEALFFFNDLGRVSGF